LKNTSPLFNGTRGGEVPTANEREYAVLTGWSFPRVPTYREDKKGRKRQYEREDDIIEREDERMEKRGEGEEKE